MIYTKEMSVGEIYRHHPIGQDLLNILAGLGSKKYGFCKNPHVGNMSLEFIAQMLAHLVDERHFDQMITILNKNPMKIETYAALADEIWWKKAVFYQCDDLEEHTLLKASELGVDCVVVPWELFGNISIQEVMTLASGMNLKLVLKMDTNFEKMIAARLSVRKEQIKDEILKKISELLEQGIHGILLENADLLTASETADNVCSLGRMAAIGDTGEILFDPEIEVFAGELLKIVEDHNAVLIGETVFDGIALDAARTLGSKKAFHLITHKLTMQGMCPGETADLNDLKNELLERYEAVPQYWPVLNFETGSRIYMTDAVDAEGDLKEKVHTMLAVIQSTLPETIYLHQKEVSGAEVFYKNLLQFRKQSLPLISGTLHIENQKLYDLMTYERIADTGEKIRVECNLSKYDGVVPYGRSENGKCLISNYETPEKLLRPYEVNVYEYV